MATEVLIIGGGVIGLSIARELHKRGAGRITIVDKGRVGAEASWAAAGMLAPDVECHAADELFRLCTASNALYPAFAAELVEETGVNIELDQSGTLVVSFDDADGAERSRACDWQKEAGISVESLSAEEARDREPQISPLVRSALFYPNDGQVNNRKLVTALRRYCEKNSIEIREGTLVDRIDINDGRIARVRTSGGDIAAKIVVVAAGAWTSQLGLGSLPEVKPIRGQVISLAGKTRKLNSVIHGPGAYIVPRADGQVLVGATVEDDGFDKTVTAEAIENLRSSAIRVAPFLADLDIVEAWAGLRPFVAGELPVIGPLADVENGFVATGHYRNGILLAPITARMIADLMVGSEPAVTATSGSRS